MSIATIPNSDGQSKAVETSSQSRKGPAESKTSSAAFNRLTEYEVGQPAGTNGNGRCRPHQGGESRLDAHSGNGRQHGHEDLPGAAEEQAVNRPVRRVEKRKVCDLKPYPLQECFFADESEEADLELAANMQKNGLRERPEILPDNTIIKGHRRIGAAKHNGWTEIKVVVRYDLVGNDKAIEEEFLEDNYMRRQLSPLERARCAKRLLELAEDDKLTDRQQAALRRKIYAKIGRLFDRSGKTVERWLHILETPLEVQLAFSADKLKVTLADRVYGLDQDIQQKIAAEIKSRGVEHATAIVKEYLPKRAETPKGADKAYMKFKQVLHEVIEDGLMDNVDDIRWLFQEDLDLFGDAKKLIGKLETRIEERIEEEEEDLAG